MSEITSSRFSQSTSNNSKNKKPSISLSRINCTSNMFPEKDEIKGEYEDYIITKKEKNLNINKIELLKNRINNLKQQELKNIREIEVLQQREEKMKKIKNYKKENKKMIEDYRKKEQEKFILIKKKIQEERQAQINNLNNSLLRKTENLNKKIQKLKNSKNEIKNKIFKNNNTVLNINKLKYEKAKTSLIFNKDKNMILKTEKGEQKRKNRLEIINKDKKKNVSLEKSIELLEQEEEKYLNLIKQTKLLKQKLNNYLINSTIEDNKSLMNKSNDNIYNISISRGNHMKKKFIRLKTNDLYNNKIIKIKNDINRRTFHNSLDLSFINNFYNKTKKLYTNEKNNKDLFYRKMIEKFESKSYNNKLYKNENSSFENAKKRDFSNINIKPKKFILQQKIIDKITSIKLRSNFES